MSWTRIAPAPGMGLQEQWTFRPHTMPPLCSLRTADGAWDASMLNRSGISTVKVVISRQLALAETQRCCEATLREMGWSWTEAIGPRHKKKEGKR